RPRKDQHARPPTSPRAHPRFGYISVYARAWCGAFGDRGRGLVLAADAPGAKWAGVRADLFEGAGEGFDLVFGQVLREVSFDPVSVVAAGAFHRLGAVVGENDEDRAPVVLGANAADEPCLFHPVD